MNNLAVIKLGGDIIADAVRLAAFATDLRQVLERGILPVVVHGGGPQISALTNRVGLETTKVSGRRVTSPEVLELVKMALAGSVSIDLTAACRAAGVPGVGLSGVSGIVHATRRPPVKVTGAGEALVDFGQVGDITRISVAEIIALQSAGLVPLINPLCLGPDGAVFNVNADVVACRMAAALKAKWLMLLTSADGVMDDLNVPESRYPELSPQGARQLIADGVISGGMIPKVEEALGVLSAGVGQVCILPGGIPGALRGAFDGSTDFGTRLFVQGGPR
ncbi:MAG: acetylglutamate kinase [Myxococcota bacterium]